MKHTDRNIFNLVQEIFFKNQPIPLDVYCKESEHTERAADIINFRKFIEKEGFQYDIATRANWDYRYKRFKDEEKEMFKKKEPSSFLDKSKEFLKKCYDAGEIIEYNDGQEWKDLPSGLPLDFSQFKEGTIRLKLIELKIPIQGLQSTFKENLDQELLDYITRNKMLDYVMKDMKDLTDQTTIRTFMDVMNYIRWEFNNIESKFKNISNTDAATGENK